VEIVESGMLLTTLSYFIFWPISQKNVHLFQICKVIDDTVMPYVQNP